jgi:hypothetical protein
MARDYPTLRRPGNKGEPLTVLDFAGEEVGQSVPSEIAAFTPPPLVVMRGLTLGKNTLFTMSQIPAAFRWTLCTPIFGTFGCRENDEISTHWS